MTVGSINPYEQPVLLVGNVANYTYNFDAYEPSHVRVQLQKQNSNDVNLVFGVDYTVTPASGTDIGGTVTLNASILSTYDGYLIVVFRSTATTQEVALPNQGPYFSETVESMHDKLTMALQENIYAANRTLRVPVGYSGGTLTVGQNGTVPVWGEGNTLNSSTTTIGDIAQAGAFAQAAKAAKDAAETALNEVNTTVRRTAEANTVSHASTLTPGASVEVLITAGYAVPGDYGGGRYKKATSEPTHIAKIQTADDQWWELAESRPKAAHFGVAGNANYLDGTGGNDDTVALNAFLAYLYRSPYLAGDLQGYEGNQFRVTAPLNVWPNSVVKATGQNAFIWAKHSLEVIKPYRSRPNYYSATGVDPNGGPNGVPGGIVPNTAQRSDGVVLENFHIDGNNTASTGISGENASLWKLTNISVRKCIRGVNLYNSVDPDDVLDAANYWTITGVMVSNCSVGYQFDMNCNSNSLMNCRTNQCTESIRNYGNHNSAMHCEFEGGTLGITLRNATLPWVSGSYATYNFVLEGGNTYRCAIAHTTTTFAADLASGKWILIGAGGYFSYTFISAFNRFESINTAHYSYAGTSQPIINSNYYQHVTAVHYVPTDLGTGNQPQLFGTEGLQFGPSGSRYAELIEVSIDVNFGTVNGGTTKDVNISAALVAACGYKVNDWYDVIVAGLPVNITATREPNYIRLTNVGATVNVGTKTVRVQIWKV